MSSLWASISPGSRSSAAATTPRLGADGGACARSARPEAVPERPSRRGPRREQSASSARSSSPRPVATWARKQPVQCGRQLAARSLCNGSLRQVEAAGAQGRFARGPRSGPGLRNRANPRAESTPPARAARAKINPRKPDRLGVRLSSSNDRVSNQSSRQSYSRCRIAAPSV